MRPPPPPLPPPPQAALAGDYWRVQRRQLEWLPEGLANALLAGLLEQGRIQAPQLALFSHHASAVHLRGPAIGADWL